jgi:glutaminase
MSFDTVKRTMQLLFSAGMFNYSGEWACTVGLPAKSGVAGCIFVVVPKILGLSVYSPPLDKYGNSVRGVEFATKVAEKFGWNVFDILYHSTARVATVENHHHD